MSAISFHLVPIFFIHVCLMWEYLMTKFFVGLVNVPLREDVEGGADKSKESGVEVDRAVRIQGHVHGDKTLKRKKCQHRTMQWRWWRTLQATR